MTIVRSALVAALAVVIGLTPFMSETPHAGSVVVGYLSSSSLSISRDFISAFKQGLKEAGYVDGENVAIEYRWANGHYDQLPALATDLINRGAVAIVTGGPPATLAARSVTSTIPIVFLVGEAVPLGLAASLSRPGGNATGVSILATSLWPKRLGLMSELLPKATAIAMLVNPKSRDEPTAADMQQQARKLGRHVFFVTATTEREIDAAFSAAVQQHAGALLVSADPLFTSRSDQIVGLAARHALPAMYGWREHVTAGGLISYGAYTGRILQGAKPADLPVEQPTKFELVINLKTAKALGLTIPPSLLLRADQVIEM